MPSVALWLCAFCAKRRGVACPKLSEEGPCDDCGKTRRLGVVTP